MRRGPRGVGRFVLLLASLFVVAGCVAPSTTAVPTDAPVPTDSTPATPLVMPSARPTASPSPSPSPRPSFEIPASPFPNSIEAVDATGDFRLTFVLERTIVRAGEPIEGLVTFGFAGPGVAAISGSGGGPFGFALVEVSGARAIHPGYSDDCMTSSLPAGEPLTHPVRMISGGWDGDDPNAPFYASLFDDPVLRLPAGIWDITAYAIFIPAAGCAADEVTLTALLRIAVTE